MKKLAIVAMVLVGVAVSLGITQMQAVVSPVLFDLKFEEVPPPDGIVGAPPKFKVTQATLDYLTELKEDGTIITVGGNGQIKVE